MVILVVAEFQDLSIFVPVLSVSLLLHCLHIEGKKKQLLCFQGLEIDPFSADL